MASWKSALPEHFEYYTVHINGRVHGITSYVPFYVNPVEQPAAQESDLVKVIKLTGSILLAVAEATCDNKKK